MIRDERAEVLAQRPQEGLQDLDECVARAKAHTRGTVPSVMRNVCGKGGLALQVRCGVGPHDKMCELLKTIACEGKPDVGTITVDSYTRNRMFRYVDDHFTSPHFLSSLNGYPVVNHGVARCRELVDIAGGVVEIRHGTPDPRLLAEVSLAAGATGFEGGPISYTIPYSKTYPLRQAFSNWRYVNELVAVYGSKGIEIERETFGTLTAVLVPPVLSVVVNLIEVLHMLASGVRFINVSFAQSGSTLQDFAVVRVLRRWLNRTLSDLSQPAAEYCLTYHMWMGPFPRNPECALHLIDEGLDIARSVGADRVILKTPVEAMRIPTAAENVNVLERCRRRLEHLQPTPAPPGIDEEVHWLSREVDELMAPILDTHRPIEDSSVEAFRRGHLDIPYAPSREVRGEVVTMRDLEGAVRFCAFGRLPFSGHVRRFHRKRLASRVRTDRASWISMIQRDIFFTGGSHNEDSAGNSQD